MWWSKNKNPIADDPEVVMELERAEKQLLKVDAQETYVNRLTAKLVGARELDPFGDNLKISFMPRGRH